MCFSWMQCKKKRKITRRLGPNRMEEKNRPIMIQFAEYCHEVRRFKQKCQCPIRVFVFFFYDIQFSNIKILIRWT